VRSKQISYYLDSSAILKLIIKEAESDSLRKFINTKVITSAISRVEVIRTLSLNDESLIIAGQMVLEKFELMPLSRPILTIAENFSSQITLRSLDALQVASVIFLSPMVKSLITYDKNMIKNAKALGISVVSPGFK
jgi:predicted nucleic acid-binding protein